MERYKGIIPDWEKFIEAIHTPLPTVIRANTLKTTPDVLRSRLESRGLKLKPLGWNPLLFQVEGDVPIGATLEHWLGLYYVQEATQTLPALALDPKPGERILDLCAAPGGKTTQIAALMDNRGTLVANDMNPKRLRALMANVYRLGAICCVVTECRGEHFPGEGIFDRALVDAPCSAEGTARKYPHLRGGASLSYVQRMAAIQRGLLYRALELVVPGGIVVYSTCTIAPEENEGVVSGALRKGLAELLPWEPPVPHARGLPRFGREEYGEEMERAVRIYPHHFDSDGGFIAVLRRLG
ncbi:MAG: RsmB/NOP family class I SAM-dependent RNA methyltransferase [Caldiserica bacterium]|nr:RsmB/NOP family class I SAM-dependent RNA methyltransferase [Caldisericota bacterium]